MELSTPLCGDLSLSIADQPSCADGYPIARLPKGLLLRRDGDDLVEEGVGFGVPILKRGAQTIFPGGVRLTGPREGAPWGAAATFEMNLVERLAAPGGGGPASRAFYALRDSLAALHRRCPPLRRALTASSNAVRHTCGWVTTFEETETRATLSVAYGLSDRRGAVRVTVDFAGLPDDGVTEVVVMNELGALHFDRYTDSDGARLRGAEIGTWNRVAAAQASLLSATARVAFTLEQVEGARLYRGRELVGERLAWCGFGYSLSPSAGSFSYDVAIALIP